MSKTMRTLFVMDPFSTVNIERDTTYVLMKEAQKRGHEVLSCQVEDLYRSGSGSGAHAVATDVLLDPAEPLRAAGPVTDLSLADIDVVWMRKDPPFDINYIFATYLLDGVDPDRTLVLNKPSGLREANEKAFILGYGEYTPVSMVTRRPADVYAFLASQGGRCIIKPLDGMGGLGVFLLREDDPNLSSLIETSTADGRKYVMVQAYVPEAKLGDKRIIVIDGEPVGATLRVPPEGELRGNIHVGAVCVKTDVTAREREICAALAPRLRELGLVFVGIDVLGDYLSEVNVTSPTGVQEINRLNGDCLEAVMWDWIDDRKSS